MKKLISIFTLFALIFSLSVPVYGADPTETQENFTIEETIALIIGSDVSYSVLFEGETEPQKGKIKPVYVPYDLSQNTNANKNTAFIYFPIPGIRDKLVTSLDLVFSFPFTITSLSSLYFGISPVTYSTSNTSSFVIDYYRSYYFTYQIDNTNNAVGSQVIDSFSTNVYNAYSKGFFLLSDSSYAYGNIISSNGVYSYKRNNDLYYFGGSQSYKNYAVLNGDFQDINTFGFSWSVDTSKFSVKSSSAFKGIGFVFAPMTITYASGGGYNPDIIIPDPTDPDPPVDPDPTEPTKGEYAQQLDDIYNKLVEQGELDKQIMNQNKEVIDNQNEIKGKIDTITTPDEQTKQDVTDFETQVDENDKKLGDVAEGMKIDVPDIETELDTSVIDDALKDNNVLKIFNSIWLTDERLVGVVVLSFLFTIFGVIIRGAYH